MFDQHKGSEKMVNVVIPPDLVEKKNENGKKDLDHFQTVDPLIFRCILAQHLLSLQEKAFMNLIDRKNTKPINPERTVLRRMIEYYVYSNTLPVLFCSTLYFGGKENQTQFSVYQMKESVCVHFLFRFSFFLILE
jgi:hypothetical protein